MTIENFIASQQAMQELGHPQPLSSEWQSFRARRSSRPTPVDVQASSIDRDQLEVFRQQGVPLVPDGIEILRWRPGVDDDIRDVIAARACDRTQKNLLRVSERHGANRP